MHTSVLEERIDRDALTQHKSPPSEVTAADREY